MDFTITIPGRSHRLTIEFINLAAETVDFKGFHSSYNQGSAAGSDYDKEFHGVVY